MADTAEATRRSRVPQLQRQLSRRNDMQLVPKKDA
jgi:hypothetical protein